MREHSQYLVKVTEELDVYRRHLLFEQELTYQQKQVFEKVNIARGWLKQGYSDSKVLDLLRTDEKTRLQERRAREVMAIAYELYADIRLNRNPDGLKLLYAEIFKDAAQLVLSEAQKAFDEGDRKGGSELMKTFKALNAEAAQLDGAYDAKVNDLSGKKKPTKVVIKRVSKNINGQKQDDFTEEAHFEVKE